MTETTASKTTVFAVPDMSCGHCEATIRQALAKALPSARVGVDLSRHEVTVDGDRARAETAIREAGYSPEVVG